MPGYHTRQVVVRLGERDFHIRALSDKQQFADPHGAAERAGISSAQWCLFGQIWPAGRVLAEAMHDFVLRDKRILELGCGLGLASLMLQSRGANITASDHHPLTQVFLNHNADLNHLPHIPYCDLAWGMMQPNLGLFDVIIGSDVLYERDHPNLLANLIERHLKPSGEVLITDPGRGNSAPLTRHLLTQGFEVSETRARFNDHDLPPYRGKLLHYQRRAVAIV